MIELCASFCDASLFGLVLKGYPKDGLKKWSKDVIGLNPPTFLEGS